MALYKSEGLNRILPKLYLKIVPVTQNETTLYANDGDQSIHISDFYCESIRHLKLSKYECEINSLLLDHLRLKYTYACVAIYPAQLDFAAQRSCLRKVCWFAYHSQHFMSAYEFGLSEKATEFAVKKYCSYHWILKKVLEEIEKFTHN
ncbi:7035_t:CDS:2 [Dentiscutata heterogama]|uniref:7035_t:CDS:1 n=1 Tax=Dentiscutata heterogama TaxID=1316150 RepID=A0ACA9K5H7_9GLOM|nr:7035_t:CDS:2 [Dentiscutata heterogama]